MIAPDPGSTQPATPEVSVAIGHRDLATQEHPREVQGTRLLSMWRHPGPGQGGGRAVQEQPILAMWTDYFPLASLSLPGCYP